MTVMRANIEVVDNGYVIHIYGEDGKASSTKNFVAFKLSDIPEILEDNGLKHKARERV